MTNKLYKIGKNGWELKDFNADLTVWKHNLYFIKKPVGKNAQGHDCKSLHEKFNEIYNLSNFLICQCKTIQKNNIGFVDIDKNDN